MVQSLAGDARVASGIARPRKQQQVSPNRHADTAMLTLTLIGGFGDNLEPIQMAFPFATVEPLMRLLTPALPDSDAAPVYVGKPKWSAVLTM